MQKLYHHSPKTNRQSILKNGLLTSFDQTGDENSIKGIYLTDRPDFSGKNSDVYEVDVSNLSVEEDWSTTPEGDENWYVVYEDIPLNRLKLILKEEIEYGWKQINDAKEKKYGKLRNMAKELKKIAKKDQLTKSGFKEWFLSEEKGMKKSNFKSKRPEGVRDLEQDLSKDFKGHIEKNGDVEPFKILKSKGK